MMKKCVQLCVLLMGVLLCFSLVGCSGGDEPGAVDGGKETAPKAVSAEEVVTALQQAFPEAIDTIMVFDEETDPNGKLGRPGNYTGKAKFTDQRIEGNAMLSDELKEGGDIEIFASEKDCTNRYEYLCAMSDPEMGAFGVNAYIYKYDRAIFRVSYELTPEQADAYQAAMDHILGEQSVAFQE